MPLHLDTHNVKVIQADVKRLYDYLEDLVEQAVDPGHTVDMHSVLSDIDFALYQATVDLEEAVRLIQKHDAEPIGEGE